MPMTDKKALTCLLFLALASVVFAAGNVVQIPTRFPCLNSSTIRAS